jgi:hypothetical protein
MLVCNRIEQLAVGPNKRAHMAGRVCMQVAVGKQLKDILGMADAQKIGFMAHVSVTNRPHLYMTIWSCWVDEARCGHFNLTRGVDCACTLCMRCRRMRSGMTGKRRTDTQSEACRADAQHPVPFYPVFPAEAAALMCCEEAD